MRTIYKIILTGTLCLTVLFADAQSNILVKDLLQQVQADPSAYRSFSKRNGWEHTYGGAVEGGMIGTDSFLRKGTTMIKSYGYYSLRSINWDGIWEVPYREKNRKRREKDIANMIAMRDTLWDGYREADWTEIKFLVVSHSAGQDIIRQAHEIGTEDTTVCFELKPLGAVRKRFIIGSMYLLVVDSYTSASGGLYYNVALTAPRCRPMQDQ